MFLVGLRRKRRKKNYFLVSFLKSLEKSSVSFIGWMLDIGKKASIGQYYPN
jgi:hypothetical protein